MFIDDVMNKYPDISKPDAIFDIQNVADYFYQVYARKIEGDMYRDIYEVDHNSIMELSLPLMAPFYRQWFIYKDNRADSKSFVGCLIKINNNELSINIYRSSLYYKCISLGGFIIKLNNKGYKEGSSYNYYGADKSDYISMPHISDKEIHTAARIELLICVLSLGFLNCKNVIHVKHQLDANHIKSRQKRNKPYFEKYYTLAIEPIKKILNTEGEAESKGLAHALHICRGHFKDYTEKGLFGKIKGTFWWTATLRGNEEVGKITKDYEIKATK